MITSGTKLVFTDIDGTALRHNTDEPTRGVIEAVTRFHEQDGILVPVTTRSAALMATPAARLRLRDLGVLDGGATELDFAAQPKLPERTRWLPPDRIRLVINAIGAFCTKISYEEEYYSYHPANIDPDAITEPAPSVFAVYETGHEASIVNLLSMLGVDGHPNTYEDNTALRCIQVVRSGVSKRSGIERLLAGPYATIAPHQIAGIDDGQASGSILAALPEGALRLAMGNAHSTLIELADYVVPSVDDDGFQVALDNIMQGTYQ